MSELDLQDASTLGTSQQIEAEKSEEQKETEKKAERETYETAALNQHPGFMRLRKKMEKDIQDIIELKGVSMKKYTDKELGEVVRGEHRVAERLKSYLQEVDDAVRAVGDGRT